MTDHIRGALIPSLWGVVSGYFHDVELRMISELALMPAGKWQKYSHDSTHKVPIPNGLSFIRDTPMCSGDLISERLLFLYEAMTCGCLNVVEWVRMGTEEEKAPTLAAIQVGAIISDRIEMLDWVQQTYSSNIDWSGDYIVRLAYDHRKNNSLKWLIPKISASPVEFDLMMIIYDDLEVLQIYFANKNTSAERMLRLFPLALTHASPPTIDWVYNRTDDRIDKKSVHENWYVEAACSGKVSNLDWLQSHEFVGLPGDFDLLGFAGTVDAARWLRAHGCQWSSHGGEICTYAGRGTVDMLEYAVSDGCPWSSAAYRVAAACDHLEVITWAVAKGYPCDPAALMRFLGKNRRHKSAPRVYEWLKKQLGT